MSDTSLLIVYRDGRDMAVYIARHREGGRFFGDLEPAKGGI